MYCRNRRLTQSSCLLEIKFPSIKYLFASLLFSFSPIWALRALTIFFFRPIITQLDLLFESGENAFKIGWFTFAQGRWSSLVQDPGLGS